MIVFYESPKSQLQWIPGVFSCSRAFTKDSKEFAALSFPNWTVPGVSCCGKEAGGLAGRPCWLVVPLAYSPNQLRLATVAKRPSKSALHIEKVDILWLSRRRCLMHASPVFNGILLSRFPGAGPAVLEVGGAPRTKMLANTADKAPEQDLHRRDRIQPCVLDVLWYRGLTGAMLLTIEATCTRDRFRSKVHVYLDILLTVELH